MEIDLTDEHAAKLAKLASQRGVSLQEMIVEALEWFVSREETRLRANEMLGKFRSGLGDVARNHDDYLAEDFR